jgi:uncharacterized RDD family membrane protein YckC
VTPIPDRARELQSLRAGIVSRLTADAVDLVAIILLGVILLVVAAGIRALFTRSFELALPAQPAPGILAGVLFIAYLSIGWGVNGRTVGKALLGLRVVGADGSDLSPSRAFARAVLYGIFPPGLLWAAVSSRNASIQDLVLGTAVVHDWGYQARAAAGA